MPASSLRPIDARRPRKRHPGRTSRRCRKPARLLLQSPAVIRRHLTHLASRRTLAAGLLPNTTGALEGWIADPQSAKPGVKMPRSYLPPDGSLVAVAIVLTAFVSFELWGHPMFATGLPWLSMSFFTAASLMIALASGTQVFAWIATIWRSRPSLKLPMLYMLAFLSLFGIGGLTGVMIAVVPFDWQVHDTYFLVAHFHYVLIGGVVFPALGGMYFWQPKMTGRLMSDRLGRISFWLTYIGFNLTFFPMHILSFQRMPRRVYTFPANLRMETGNLAATIGAFILGTGFALYLANAWVSGKRGAPAPTAPWRGETLEWRLSSPPPEDNWRVPPIVHSRHPLWSAASRKEGTEGEMRVRRVFIETPKPWLFALVMTILDADPQALQSCPHPSYIPFAISLTVTILLLETLTFSKGLIYLGLAATVLCVTPNWGNAPACRTDFSRFGYVRCEWLLSVVATNRFLSRHSNDSSRIILRTRLLLTGSPSRWSCSVTRR